MTNRKRSTKKASEISKECRNLYEEIDELQKHFGWRTRTLCEKIEYYIEDDSIISHDTDGAKARRDKLYEKLKKTFQRKNWEQDSATSSTRKLLEAVRNSIYMTDQYRDSELYESDLPSEFRREMGKIAKEIQHDVDEEDYD